MSRKEKEGAAAKGKVLSQALLSIIDELKLSQSDLADILGVHRSKISRMSDDKATIHPDDRNEGDKAKLFLRIYRSLSILTNGNAEQIRAWLSSDNLDIGGIPMDAMKTTLGIVHVANYLDAMRGKI